MSVLFANVLSLSILLLFISHRYFRTRSWIEPGAIFAINLLVLYPIRGLVLFLSQGAAATDYLEVYNQENLESTSWLAALGCFSFVVGYLIVIGRGKLPILNGRARRTQPEDVLVCTILFGASLVGIAYKFATKDYISYLISDTRILALTQLGNLLNLLQWPTYVGVWVLWFRKLRSPRFIALFVSVQCVIVPLQFIQGSKTYLSLLLLSVLFAYYWSRGKVPKITALASAAIIVLFVFPYVSSFRDLVNTRYQTIPDLSSLDLQEIRQLVLNTADAESNESQTLQHRLYDVSFRYSGIDQLYKLTTMVPVVMPYRFGAGYIASLTALVPRVLWPEKPIYSRGAVYGAALGTITSITPFPVGEAYWDFGVTGVFISMIVWGACLAGLVRGYALLYNKPRLSFFGGIYFLSQIYWIAGGETSMPETVSLLPQQLAVLFVLYLLLRALTRRGEIGMLAEPCRT